MPKVSVIVPVYNTEKYLPQCIDSILAQTFTDFELILVNDGSTDNSGKICDKYAEKDQSIVVIHQENSGANRARETGVNISRGEWITFVDSDDTILLNAIELLINNISDNIDIVIGQIFKTKRRTKILSISDYRKKLLIGKFAHPVAKLYRRQIFHDEIFNIHNYITIGEDMLMNIKLAFSIKQNVKIIPDVVYNYNYRENSAINTRSNSVTYETLFWTQLNNSIPSNEIKEYKKELFYHVYTQWRKFCEYSISIPSDWSTSILSKYLNENLATNRNQITLLNYLLIKIKNPILRFHIISLKKLCNRLSLVV